MQNLQKLKKMLCFYACKQERNNKLLSLDQIYRRIYLKAVVHCAYTDSCVPCNIFFPGGFPSRLFDDSFRLLEGV